MITLYKFNDHEVLYWQAWEDGTEIIAHWGEVGDRGETQVFPAQRGENAEQTMTREAGKYRHEGYRELAEDDEIVFIVRYQIDGMGTPDDLGKRYSVENLLDECLGWTGNGRCDGGDIGSGAMSVCSVVVNPYLAAKTIVEELRGRGWLEGAVMAVEREESFEVLYPENHGGQFHY